MTDMLDLDQPYRAKFCRDLDALTGSPESTDALLDHANATASERIRHVVIDEHQQGVVMAGWLLTFPEVLAAVLPDLLAEAWEEAAEAKLEAVRAYCAAYVDGSGDADPEPWNPAAYVLAIIDGTEEADR